MQKPIPVPVEVINAPLKRDSEVFASRFFPHSEKKQENPEVYHSFFRDHPLQKFNKDISILEHVSYDCPSKNLLNRNYVVVEEKVTYGKPLTPEQLEQLRFRKQKEPEVVTWGVKDNSRLNLKINSIPRENIVVQKEGVSSSLLCCCAPNVQQNDVLVQKI